MICIIMDMRAHSTVKASHEHEAKHRFHLHFVMILLNVLFCAFSTTIFMIILFLLHFSIRSVTLFCFTFYNLAKVVNVRFFFCEWNNIDMRVNITYRFHRNKNMQIFSLIIIIKITQTNTFSAFAAI